LFLRISGPHGLKYPLTVRSDNSYLRGKLPRREGAVSLFEVKDLARPAPQALAATIEQLAARFGNRLVTSQAVRDQHAHTTTWLKPQPPDAVVMAQETKDIQDVVRICAAHRVPVIAFGAGTSLEGQVNAPAGGVCIDLRDMNRVLAVHAEDLDCVIEPGVTRKLLNENLRDQGLFFPIDPGADASIGGMASTRASGTNAVRYGTMRDNVLALKVVRGDGEIITTGTRAKKSSAGYDLTHLFIGAEGTLGIISEITLKLRGIPESMAAAACSFETVEGACKATILAIQTGIPVARIELLNEAQVRACNAYSKLTLPETPLLLLEFHGTEAEVAAQSQSFADIADECGARGFEWTTRPEDRTRLWQARHDAYWAARGLRSGAETFATDVCVPISRLAECVVETERDLKDNRIEAPIVGHVGDGNFHVVVLCDTSDAGEFGRVEGFLDRLVKRAQAMDGTCTGEHGIGQGKQKYLESELGPEAVAAMRALKAALDPQNIFNPGKILP
jgi:D-lactate dehydrogenase (cytochrome)